MAKCTICNRRGRCTCQRRINTSAAARPQAQPRPCTNMCGRTKDKPCGATVRAGVCPCAYC